MNYSKKHLKRIAEKDKSECYHFHAWYYSESGSRNRIFKAAVLKAVCDALERIEARKQEGENNYAGEKPELQTERNS